MAEKPDLSAASGVQNVVVYVSNDNFAQAYAVGQQNVPPNNNPIHSAGYANTSHSMASMVGTTKTFAEKQIIKQPEYGSSGQIVNNSTVPPQGGYFTGVISQNGFPQPIVNNINYQNGAVIKNYGNSELLLGERQAGPGRPDKVREECDNRDSYVESGYVTVMGAEVPTQSVRCDSVRSETAESSCSSLSSADESLVVVQNQPEMVVYDPSVSVRPAGVVLALRSPAVPQQPQNSSVTGTISTGQQANLVPVPFGWKRLLNNGAIIYISPSNTVLTSPEQVKEYLLTTGTCKCGLECHFKYDSIFNFDPKVGSKPWVLSPDTNTGDLTKLCNHKRKIIAMASLDCKPPDPNVKLRKEYNVKRKKRKIGLPYAGGVSVSQILAHREKLALNQHNLSKDVGNPQQLWSQQPVNSPQIMPNRLHNYPETPQNHHVVRCQDPQGARIIPGSPVVVGDNNMMLQQPNVSNNISHQQISQNQPIHHANSNPSQVNIQSQQIFGPNGQLINIQSTINPNHAHSMDQMPQSNAGGGMVLQGQNFVQTQQSNQHRIFINGQPNEPSGPGRPNIQMIPVSLPNQQNVINQQRQEMQQRNQLPPHQQQQQQHIQFFNNQSQYMQPQPYDPNKNIRPFNQVMNGFRPQGLSNNPNNQVVPIPTQVQHQQQKMQWHNRIPQNINQQQQNQHQQQQPNQMPMNHPNQLIQQNQAANVYERVPPLHQHTPSSTVWQEEIKRKKIKMGKSIKNRPYHMMDGCPPNHAPCPNIDVRQIPIESRAVIINQLPQNSQNSSSPSFMEDPSGYLAQQTALLNNTINRQTGANGYSGYICHSPVTSDQNQPQQNVSLPNSQTNEVPLPSNITMSHIKTHAQNMPNRTIQNVSIVKNQQIPNNIVMSQQYGQVQIQPNVADSSAVSEHPQYISHCQGCIADSIQQNQYVMKESHQQIQKVQNHSRPNSTPNTPSSSGTVEDPVTSSTYSEKLCNQASPDSRPIQGGTVSTSNVSPIDGSQSDPPTPNPQTPNPQTPNPHTPNSQTSNPHTPNPHTSMPQRMQDNSQMINSSMPFVVYSQPNQMQQIQQQINQQTRDVNNGIHYQNQNAPKPENICCSHVHPSNMQKNSSTIYTSGVVTTMASGRTVGHNTITSVIAGRTNTATVSINSPSSVSGSSTPTSISAQTIPPPIQTQAITVNVSKSPLEMVQSVVSSIQVPHTQQPSGSQQSNSQISPQLIKHSPTGLPPGHILVSSGGQLIMANTGSNQGGVMAPPPPKILTNQSGMPPISVSPMVTNVTASVAQVIPAVAQQVLGQQTVLVNALPAPFVLQPGVTMTMDGMAVGQNMQLPQLVTGNVIQQQIQIDNSDPRRVPSLLSPETKKKGKKRKMSSQTVASMLHIAAQQNSGVVMSQQGFPQQIQMAHSPQGITTGPVMQALTIVPSKSGGPPQIVMNGQAMANTNLGTQQLITNSQPTQQINLLQPVNLINGTTGVVQNFPAIQQFIVPNLGGMVMNPDGTATILQDTSNIGMQLQIQNVNGQNVLTPVQNSSMFNGGQSILAAGPAGMVIRAPTSQGKIIQQQQHSPGTQFLSPNGGQFVVNGAQFSGQLSPLVASVSPSQQVTFSTSPQQIRPNNNIQASQQEYIQMNGQMGQTLVVPCTPTGNIAASSSNQQNTTFVQQNTTIVQQQTTMVANNQQLQNFQQNNQNNSSTVPRATTMNLDQQNYIISSNDNKQMQAVMVQQRESPQNTPNYRQSVSTQTAVNQNAQSVTTNTFCQTSTLSAGSPPDTTTLSPIASGGQSPPTADTTTHSGSTDDGLSPAPSNCSASCSDINIQTRPQSCTMAMVHCISSSEPDSADLNSQNSDSDWRRGHAASTTPKADYLEVTGGPTYFNKKSTPTHVAFAESSTLVSGLQYIDQMKAQESVVSSRNYEKMMQHKRKSSDTIVIMESHRMHNSLFDDNDETESGTAKTFTVGDLIWGPAKGCPAWPGKIIEVQDDNVTVKWFGLEKSISKIDITSLRTLSEGLDAHHQARKKSRTSRKLSTQLEKAIQEAMAELDKQIDGTEKEPKEPKHTKISPKTMAQTVNIKKPSGRLRSSQR